MSSLLNRYHVLKHAPHLSLSAARRLAEYDLFALSQTELQPFNLPPETLAYIQKKDRPEVEQELSWAAQAGHHLICFDDPAYPPLLKEIAQPPLVLYGIGKIELLSTPQLAIVGTRKPSPNARETALAFASALSRIGLTITSGLALGIDAASHLGALETGGATIAVLGNGLNHVYPLSNKHLYRQIAEMGLLLSEFSPATPPKAAHFPQRNRIISGLSLATLVVEAAVKSGSLITARFACEQGREVFAIPGSIHNPQARGCHALIKQGAKLIETVSDIVEELPALLNYALDFNQNSTITQPKTSSGLDKNLTNVLQYVDFAPTALELIQQRCGKNNNDIFTALIQLELAGYITSSATGYTRLANKHHGE